MSIASKTSTVLLTMLALSAGVVGARAQSNFFEGKTITITVGFGAGGGYDAYARLLAQFMNKYIPGNPSIIVSNRPGAGGLVAYNQAARTAPKDGTLIHLTSQGLLLTEVTGGPGLQASLTEFQWLGNITQSNNVTATWFTSPIKSMDDAKAREVTLSSSGGGSTSSQMALLYNHLLGTRFKPIMGYEAAGLKTSPWNAARQRDAPPTHGRATIRFMRTRNPNCTSWCKSASIAMPTCRTFRC